MSFLITEVRKRTLSNQANVDFEKLENISLTELAPTLEVPTVLPTDRLITEVRKRTLSNQANIEFEKLDDSSLSESISSPEVTIVLPTERRSDVPKRLIFTLLGFFGLFCCYAMRFNLSVAMVAMVRPPQILEDSSVEETSEVCMELMSIQEIGNGSISKTQQGEFDWDSKLQHLALGSFYFGYVAVQIPGGILAEKYYAKHFFGYGVLITAIFTLLTPIAARYSVWALVATRTIQGLGQAATWPAMNTLIGRWVPTMERSRVSAVIYTGCTVGVVVSFAVSGMLCDSSFLGGWPSVFYIFGAIGCIWFVLWTYLVYETPEDHPHISKSELAFIRKGQDVIKTKISIPWKALLTSLPVWGLVITHIGQDWGNYTLLTETPIYLNNVLHFNLKNNGFLSALPNIISAIMAFLASILADKLRQKGHLRITTIRKILNSVGFYGPGLCILLVAFAGCSPVTIIVLLSLAMGLNGFVYSGFNVTHVDMSPEFAGTLMAITNSIANVTGFMVPIFVGWVIQDGNTLHNWGIIFISAFAIFAFSGTVYNIFCTADLQEWKTPIEIVEETHDDQKSIASYQTDTLTHAQREVFRYRRMSFLV